jgi:hypothetical protein
MVFIEPVELCFHKPHILLLGNLAIFVDIPSEDWPWVINGWQSYASANSRKGLGGQIKYTPKPWMNIISNNYGLGHDDLYLPNRGRLHTDDSIEIKYYDHPENTLDKMAFSFTGAVGCEFGNGVSCHGDKAGGPKQSFLGFMLYDRTWFKRDLYGLTLEVAKSTIQAVTWCCCRPSMGRRLPVPRSIHPTSPRIREI